MNLRLTLNKETDVNSSSAEGALGLSLMEKLHSTIITLNQASPTNFKLFECDQMDSHRLKDSNNSSDKTDHTPVLGKEIDDDAINEVIPKLPAVKLGKPIDISVLNIDRSEGDENSSEFSISEYISQVSYLNGQG